MRLPLTTLLLLLAAAAGAARADAELQDLGWRAGLLGRGLAGRAVLVTAPGEGWRAEAAAAALPLETLLAAGGDGWTLVGAPDGRVWGAPWGEPLREFDPPLARTLTAAVAALTPGAATPRRLVIPAAGEAEAPDLRRRLAARAEGRGGPAETITLRQDPAAGTVRLTSRRRPGRLAIVRRGVRTVAAQPADLLLPAWSLAELLRQP